MSTGERKYGGRKPRQTAEVEFVPDNDVVHVIDAVESLKIKETPRKKGGTRNSVRRTSTTSYSPVPKGILTKSGRRVICRYDSLNVSLLNPDDRKEPESPPRDNQESPMDVDKPSVLFEDEIVAGDKLFGFNTPSRRRGMYLKASESAGKPCRTRTPRRDVNLKKDVKTPRATRSHLKQKIVEEVTRQEVDRMLEESDSEYLPSSDSDGGSDSDPGVVPLDEVPEVSPERGPITRKRRDLSNFVFTSDDYFDRRCCRTITSNRTLGKLKTPKFRQDQLRSLLNKIQPAHMKALAELERENQVMFKRWLCALNAGFNVLLYGVGSKKKLMEDFVDRYLKNSSAVVVVNGFFPGVNIKAILETVTTLYVGMKNVPTQPHEVVEAIAQHQKSSAVNHLFLVVHNLDGEQLRAEKIQSIIAQLASLPKLHLVASIDHINSPLLWDQNKLSLFNFIWEDATSLLPYMEETSYESSLMVQKSGALALTALKNVFQSLTQNTRKVFLILLEHRLQHSGRHYQGMQFSELYRTCRNDFIVSSDLALRTQLTEFLDHQLLKWKKDTDHLIIPIDDAVLKQFHSEINN